MKIAIRKWRTVVKCIANRYNIFMSDIISELETRLSSNIISQKNIEKSMEFLPRGHINILNRNDKGYYYLTYREGKKVKNEYLGVVGKTDVSKTITKLKERQLYGCQLKELKTEEKILKKLIRKAK